MNRISRFAMALLVAGGLGVAGFGMAAGTARRARRLARLRQPGRTVSLVPGR